MFIFTIHHYVIASYYLLSWRQNYAMLICYVVRYVANSVHIQANVANQCGIQYIVYRIWIKQIFKCVLNLPQCTLKECSLKMAGRGQNKSVCVYTLNRLNPDWVHHISLPPDVCGPPDMSLHKARKYIVLSCLNRKASDMVDKSILFPPCVYSQFWTLFSPTLKLEKRKWKNKMGVGAWVHTLQKAMTTGNACNSKALSLCYTVVSYKHRPTSTKLVKTHRFTEQDTR